MNISLLNSYMPVIVTIPVLIALSISDLEDQTVPVWLLISYIMAGVLYLSLFRRAEPVPYLYGAAVGMISMGVSKITREQIGIGDSYLFIGLGVWLGMDTLLNIIFYSCFAVLVIGGIRVLFKKATWKAKYPFIPFVLVGHMVLLLKRFLI